MKECYPLPRTTKEKLEHREQEAKRVGSFYQPGGEQPYIAYSVADLFSNITLDLTRRNICCAETPKITIEKTCQDARRGEVYTVFKKELEQLAQNYYALDKKGQLLQFRVKKNKLDQYFFRNKGHTLRIEGQEHDSDIHTLLELFTTTPSEKIHGKNMEFAVAVRSPLQDPNSGIACSIINSADPKEWAAYLEKEKALRNKIDRYFEEKQQVKKSYFNILGIHH